MAISNEVVVATPREGRFNKNAARRVRHAGRIPAVVYGAGQDSMAVTVDPKHITKILHSAAGHNSIFDLEVESGRTKVMIVDWQYEPVKSHLLHIDFKRIAMDKAIRVEVPVVLTGVPVGVRTQGGVLEQVLREVELECLPGDIPSSIELDVTELTFGQVKRVADLDHGGKLKFVTAEDSVVAHVVAIKEEVVETPDATAAAVGVPAEPEVAKKGKQDEAPAADAKAKK